MASLVPVWLLGLAGWLGAGPLAATLLVGRTAPLSPSIRWLAVCAAGWLVSGCIAVAGAHWAAGDSPDRSDARLIDLALSAATRVALMAAALPLLVVLYSDDAAFHLSANASPATARLLALYPAALATAGAALNWLFRRSNDRIAGELSTESSEVPRSSASSADQMALAVPLLAVTAALLLNRGLLEPLQARAPVGWWPAAVLGANLCGTALAAWVTQSWLGAGRLGGVAVFAACLVYAPWQSAVTTMQPVGLALALLALAGWGLSRGKEPASAVCFAAATLIIPAAGAGILALLSLGRWRAGLAGAATAGLLLLARSQFGAQPDSWWLALQGTPHLANVAAAGAFARLFSGAGALTAPATAPITPAVALSVGLTVTAALLGSLWVRRGSHTGLGLATVTGASVMVAFILEGTTPAQHLAAVPVLCAPLISMSFWRRAPPQRRAVTAALAGVGFVLAGTSLDRLARAATELLSAQPLAASLPLAGLLLLSAALLAGIGKPVRVAE